MSAELAPEFSGVGRDGRNLKPAPAARRGGGKPGGGGREGRNKARRVVNSLRITGILPAAPAAPAAFHPPAFADET